MANYHLSVQTIGRGAGRSACAAAAYRAGEAIHDQRTGLDHDYTRRSGVEHTQIVAPADAPAWSQDRQALWNEAESAESRKNSQTAREVEVSLPAELTSDQQQALALDLARELAERHQVAVDVAIHEPGREGDDRNHHAHMMMTTRQIAPDGFGPKTREWNGREGRETVGHWRERWADLQNERLAEHGHDARVDHRSLADQGVDREPQQHLGPTAAAIERRGEEPERARYAGIDAGDDRGNRELHEAIRNAPTERDVQAAIAADPPMRELARELDEARTGERAADRNIARAEREAREWRDANPLRAAIGGLAAGPLREATAEIERQQEIRDEARERQAAAEQAADDRRAEIEPGIRADAEPAMADAEHARAELAVRGYQSEIERIEEHGLEAEQDAGLELEHDAGAELDIADDFGSDDDAGDDEHQAAADEDAWR